MRAISPRCEFAEDPPRAGGAAAAAEQVRLIHCESSLIDVPPVARDEFCDLQRCK